MPIQFPIRAVGGATLVISLVAPSADAQRLSYRGFVEANGVLYPQDAPNDDTRVVVDATARVEPRLDLRPGISIAGSFEARIDTHEMGGAGVRYWDRTVRRPAMAARTLAVSFAKGPVSLEVGKQFVRWGQSDILSPTDYFTPRDYVVTASSEVLAVTAARLTVGSDSQSFEAVYAPRMTPSRMPLLDQRWIGVQTAVAGLGLEDGVSTFPRAPQVGVRYRRMGAIEYSVSAFQGPHHLALLEPTFRAQDTTVVVNRSYPEVRGYGADLVATAPAIILRAEVAWLQARRGNADDYGLWAAQVERQQDQWLVLGGYVGEWVSTARGARRFAPDRGLARSVVGRVSRVFDNGRTASVEGLVRQTGDGAYLKADYSRPFGGHLRLTLQLLVLGGAAADFLGQYRHNSLTGARARYSF